MLLSPNRVISQSSSHEALRLSKYLVYRIMPISAFAIQRSGYPLRAAAAPLIGVVRDLQAMSATGLWVHRRFTMRP
jgi:hypothetical protein